MHESLPEHELDERRLLQHDGLAVHLHARLTRITESMDGQGCGYYIAPYAKLNWKKAPLSSTFLWMLCAKILGLLSKERREMRVEHLEALLFEMKPSTQRHFGGNKQWSGFLDTESVSLVLHCNHRTKQPGSDDCSEGLTPAKAVHLTEEEVRKFDEVPAVDSGRRTIAPAWSPSSGAFFRDRNVYYKLSGVNKAKRYHERKNPQAQQQLDDAGNAPGKTSSIDQVVWFAVAQNRTLEPRWDAVKEPRTARQLRMTIDIKKRTLVDSSFQALRKKVGRNKDVMLLYGSGSFSPASRDEDSVPTGSMKRAARRHKPTKSASEFRTSRNCPFCWQPDLVPITVDRKIQTNNTALDWRTCSVCN